MAPGTPINHRCIWKGIRRSTAAAWGHPLLHRVRVAKDIIINTEGQAAGAAADSTTRAGVKTKPQTTKPAAARPTPSKAATACGRSPSGCWGREPSGEEIYQLNTSTVGDNPNLIYPQGRCIICRRKGDKEGGGSLLRLSDPHRLNRIRIYLHSCRGLRRGRQWLALLLFDRHS